MRSYEIVLAAAANDLVNIFKIFLKSLGFEFYLGVTVYFTTISDQDIHKIFLKLTVAKKKHLEATVLKIILAKNDKFWDFFAVISIKICTKSKPLVAGIEHETQNS